MADILVLGEILEGVFRKNSLSAVRFATEVAQASSGAFDILVIGDGADAAAQEAAKYGARKVLKAQVDGGYVAEKLAATVAKVDGDGGYKVVVATAGTTGKDLLPRVAAKLGAGVASDIASVERKEGALSYRRAMYAGNIFGLCTIRSDVEVVTVRQTEFEAVEEAGSTSPIESVEVVEDPVAARLEFISVESQKSERPDLADADVVVS